MRTKSLPAKKAKTAGVAKGVATADVVIVSCAHIEMHLATRPPVNTRLPHSPPFPARDITAETLHSILSQNVEGSRALRQRAWESLLGTTLKIYVLPIKLPFFEFREWQVAEPLDSRTKRNRWKCKTFSSYSGSSENEDPKKPPDPMETEETQSEVKKLDVGECKVLIVDPLPLGLTESFRSLVRKVRKNRDVIVLFRVEIGDDGKPIEKLAQTLRHWKWRRGNKGRVWIVASFRELVQSGDISTPPLRWVELGNQLKRNRSLGNALVRAKAGLLFHCVSRGAALWDGTIPKSNFPQLVLKVWDGQLPQEEPPWQNGVVPGVARVWTASLARALLKKTNPSKIATITLEEGLIDARLHDTYGPDFSKARMEYPSSEIATYRDEFLLLSKKEASEKQKDPDTILKGHIETLPDAKPSKKRILDVLEERLAGKSTSWPWLVAGFGKAEVPDFENEIGSLVAMRQLVKAYSENTLRDKPLNLLVVGEPGSGKSFVVQQLLGSVLKPLEFSTLNMTQVVSREELWAEYEKLRTHSIRNRVGVLFVDEFDTKHDKAEFGWVSQFLGPMQDGEYATPSGLKPLGRCVLVFAGGIAKSLREIQRKNYKKAEKVPDFVSRIHGSHEVPPFESDSGEGALRLALLISGRFKISWPEAHRVDRGLLEALMTSKYRHGARSVSGLIASLQARGKPIVGLGELPATPTLKIHVRGGPLFRG